jgi:regulator of protease activity HflC (stomatin/prohibitin superfamily)
MEPRSLRRLVGGIVIAVILLILMVNSVGCEGIDAGHEGIKVKRYGDEKGVQEISLVTGMVFYNKYTEQVFEYPVFVKTVDYGAFAINAKDGSVFGIDPTLTLQVTPGKAPYIFKKYRRPLEEVIGTSIYNYVKEAYRTELNTFKTDSIISNRQLVEVAVEKKLRKLLSDEGFTMVQLSSGLSYPQTIVDAIDAKNTAIQEAMKVENELKVAEMNARKLIIEAEAERKSNELKQQSLTPLLIQMAFINKWDGKTPLYGNVPTFFKNVP